MLTIRAAVHGRALPAVHAGTVDEAARLLHEVCQVHLGEVPPALVRPFALVQAVMSDAACAWSWEWAGRALGVRIDHPAPSFA